jgi:hypothetical protein
MIGEWDMRWAIYGGTVLFLLSDAVQANCLQDEGHDRHLVRHGVQLPGIDEAQFRPLT